MIKYNNSNIMYAIAVFKYGTPHCNLHNGFKLELDMSRESEQFSKCCESQSWRLVDRQNSSKKVPKVLKN